MRDGSLALRHGNIVVHRPGVTKKLIVRGEEYIVEGPLGMFSEGRIVNSETRNGVTYHRPEVTGREFITGYNKFVLSDRDPFPEGYQVGVN